MDSEINKLQLIISILSIMLAFSLLLNLGLASTLEKEQFHKYRENDLKTNYKRVFEKVGIVINERARKERSLNDEKKAYYNVPLSYSLQNYMRERCEAYGIDMKLALAVIKTESGFYSKAISETHDYGLMQINYDNHAWLSEMLGITNLMDDKQNIEAGLYLLHNAFLNADTVEKALMVYNMGLGAAMECWEQGVNETVYSSVVLENYKTIEEE